MVDLFCEATRPVFPNQSGVKFTESTASQYRSSEYRSSEYKSSEYRSSEYRSPEYKYAPAPFPFSPLQTGCVELVVPDGVSTSLDFDALQGFEAVHHQFQSQGVTFENAIALVPSNPAFPPTAGRIVLMGGPRNGWLEARFHRPIAYIQTCVTSSRPTVLTAFDRHNSPVGQTASPGANLAHSGSPIPPNIELSIRAANIHRITVHAFDGQFTLDQFSFQ